jgi:hypothetical protein
MPKIPVILTTAWLALLIMALPRALYAESAPCMTPLECYEQAVDKLQQARDHIDALLGKLQAGHTVNKALQLALENQKLAKENQRLIKENQSAIASITDTWQAVGTTNISTKNKSWVDMPDMSITFTLSKSADVFIDWDATLYSDNWGAFRIVLDDVPKNWGHFQQHAGHDVPCNLGWIEQELVAGSHTVKVQWALGSGTYLNNNPATDYLGGSVWSRQLRVIAFYH